MNSKVVPIREASQSGEKSTPSVDIEHVLEVSARQFAELGFDGVSMREISRECGCPAPSIYYHFASKSELYKEAYSNKIEQTIDLMNARLACVRDKRMRFETLIEAFHDLFTGDRTLLLLMQRDVIDAAVTRRGFLSQRQYDYFTSLIQRTASEATGVAVSRETSFTIGALIFGYCELSLMVHEIYDQQGTPRSEPLLRGDPAHGTRRSEPLFRGDPAQGEDLLRLERQRLVRAATALVRAS